MDNLFQVSWVIVTIFTLSLYLIILANNQAGLFSLSNSLTSYHHQILKQSKIQLKNLFGYIILFICCFIPSQLALLPSFLSYCFIMTITMITWIKNYQSYFRIINTFNLKLVITVTILNALITTIVLLNIAFVYYPLMIFIMYLLELLITEIIIYIIYYYQILVNKHHQKCFHDERDYILIISKTTICSQLIQSFLQDHYLVTSLSIDKFTFTHLARDVSKLNDIIILQTTPEKYRENDSIPAINFKYVIINLKDDLLKEKYLKLLNTQTNIYVNDFENINTMNYSLTNNKATYYGNIIESDIKGTEMRIKQNNSSYNIGTRLYGYDALSSILIALVIANEYEINKRYLQLKTQTFMGISNLHQPYKYLDWTFINDTGIDDLDLLKESIEICQQDCMLIIKPTKNSFTLKLFLEKLENNCKCCLITNKKFYLEINNSNVIMVKSFNQAVRSSLVAEINKIIVMGKVEED